MQTFHYIKTYIYFIIFIIFITTQKQLQDELIKIETNDILIGSILFLLICFFYVNIIPVQIAGLTGEKITFYKSLSITNKETLDLIPGYIALFIAAIIGGNIGYLYSNIIKKLNN